MSKDDTIPEVLELVSIMNETIISIDETQPLNEILVTSTEAEVIEKEEESDDEPPQPSQKVHKGLSFLLQQMKSAASQQPQPSSSSKVSEEAPRKRGSTEDLNVDQIKVPKVVINPWKVTADQLQHIQKSEMAEYSFDHPECLQTSVEAFKSLKEKNNRYRFTTENNYVRSIKWSPSGRFLLTNSADMRIRIVPYMEGKVDDSLMQSHCLGGMIYDQVWHPTLDVFASSSNGHPIQIFDTNFEKQATAICVNDLDELDSVYSLAFSNDGTRLYGGFQSSIYVFDLEKPAKQLYKIKTHVKGRTINQRSIFSCMAMNPVYSGSYAVGSYNGTIGFYSDQTSKLDILFEATSKNVTHLAYSPDGNTLFYGCNKSNTIQGLDVRFGCKPLVTFHRPVDTSQKIYFEIDKSGKYLISGTTNHQILVFDLSNPAATDEMLEANVVIPDKSRVCAGLSLHPTEPVMATSHGERIFPFPKIDDSDSEDDIINAKVDYGIKLWNLC